MEHLIEFKDVYKIYQMGEETVHALDGVSLTVDRGEFVAIVRSWWRGEPQCSAASLTQDFTTRYASRRRPGKSCAE